jgi:O-methyltransferase
MMKRMLRSLAKRAGYEVNRITATWRDQPVSQRELERLSQEDLRIARMVEPYTATSLARVTTLIRAVRHVARYKIPGAFVECGVWRGGSMMAIALTLLAENAADRDLFLFDTFEGMPMPTDKDKDTGGKLASDILRHSPRTRADGMWCIAGLDEVQTNMATTGYPKDKVHYVQGRVEQTIPQPGVTEVALCRLDTDWYESTRHELIHLYPKLAVGGILVIDDYGHWAGARQATDEYMREHPEYSIFLSVIDDTGRLVVKTPSRNTA